MDKLRPMSAMSRGQRIMMMALSKQLDEVKFARVSLKVNRKRAVSPSTDDYETKVKRWFRNCESSASTSVCPLLPRSPSARSHQMTTDMATTAMEPLEPADRQVDCRETGQLVVQSVPANCASVPQSHSSACAPAHQLDYPVIPEASQQATSNRGRRRRKNLSSWRKNVLKNRRNCGHEYRNRAGTKCRAKVLEPIHHKCRYRCSEVTEADREAIFRSFWGLGSWELQTGYILSSVQMKPVKRHKTDAGKKKDASHIFMLNGHRVCRYFFRKTLDIAEDRLHRALLRKQNVLSVARDGRGKHQHHSRIPTEQLDTIRRHIDEFPKYESHYSRRKNIDRQYLMPGLTLAQMYRLYCEYCSAKNVPVCKKCIYYKIFNQEYNLSFKKPSSDTCSTCDRMQNILSCGSAGERQEAVTAKGIHLRKADSARDTYRTNVAHARVESDTACIVFDLQKTLATPQLQTNKVYYMRQLWTYNLDIHDCKSGNAYMYMWHEATASRGSQEVASCLLKFCKSLPSGTERLIAYSDCCGGQNRNENIAVLWMYITQHTQIKQVDHKFFEPGHSYNACDQDFGLIEKRKRNTPYVWLPSDWYSLVANSSSKFLVTEMIQADFISLESVKKYFTIRKKADDGKPIGWLGIKQLTITREKPNVMLFKTSLCCDAEYREVTFGKKSGRPPKTQRFKQLYPAPRALKAAKIKDLTELLKFVPVEHHHFYQSLTSDADTSSVLVHPDLDNSFSASDNDD